jgi:adenylate cyclase
VRSLRCSAILPALLTLEPDVLGPLLNDYLTGMTDLVFAHDGAVAKIVGDALHVLFGAPGEQPDHAHRAVKCAQALDDYAQSFRENLADVSSWP